MRRRDFITLLAGAAAGWPLAARAQQQAMPVIGLLAAPAPAAVRHYMNAFHAGLKEMGYVEGQNTAIEYRWAGGRYEQLPEMAADLVRRQVAVIVTLAPPAATAAKAATAAIPIVFVMGADPVKLGLVASLNRPGGNVTGAAFLSNVLGGKRLEIIRELAPHVGRVGVLINLSASGSELYRQEVEQAARALGFELVILDVRSEREFETAFATLAHERAGALIVSPEALFTSHREYLVSLAARNAVPVLYHLREAVLDGGLMSYGARLSDAHRVAGVYTGRILSGAKVDELPVQQSARFELVINFKTAKTLGIEVPATLLARADEVIE
jgi:putative ABC transport system substrate-binding protein